MTSFLRDRRGSVVVLFSLSLPALLGLGALSVDVANLYYNKAKLQMAADAAALGAAVTLPDTGGAVTKALELAGQNSPSGFGTVARTIDVTIGQWDPAAKTFTPDQSHANAVQVTTHRTLAYKNAVPTYFGRFVGAGEVDVSAKSVAVRFGGACVRVLDPSAEDAFYQSGTGSATMRCPLEVNSTASTAAVTIDPASTAATSVCVRGGYEGSGFKPSPQNGCKPIVDPLAAIPEPSEPTTPCMLPSGSGTVSGDCVITGTVSLTGRVTLQSGLYYLKRATLVVSDDASLSGAGVTIFADPKSTIAIATTGAIGLAAPKTGPYAGILMFQSRNAKPETVLSVGTGGSLALDGAIYAPSSTISIGGNDGYSSSARFGYLLAGRVRLGGPSALVFNAFAAGTSPRLLRVHAGLVN